MTNDLIKLGSAALKNVASNEETKNFILQNEILCKKLKKAVTRYLAGETLDEAILSIKTISQEGYVFSTNYMGEIIRNENDASIVTNEYLSLAKSINNEKINSSISLDLSQIGLSISNDLTKYNLQQICIEAAQTNQEVIINMEGTDRTDQILEIYKETQKTHRNLGITIQAYLYRTKEDFKEIIALPGSIRLVKGGYDTPSELSIPRGNKLEEIYLEYAEQLLSKNHNCAITTHDEKILTETIKMIERYNPTNFVFERHLGICNEEFQFYKDSGFKCRLYIVYGKDWYSLLCFRWAEYPLSFFVGLADMVD